MTIEEINGWQKRFGLSFLYAIIAVVASTVILGILSSMENPGAERPGWKGADVATYIFGLPLAPGWLIVKEIYGEWRMVHGGQIVLIWPLSLAIDSILIFLVWEFLHRKASRELASKGTLGLDR